MVAKTSSPQVFGRMEKFMEPCLLLTLRQGESHGYELMEKLKELGFEGSSADMANMYRILRNLEEKEMLSSKWEEGAAGPPKRVYALTKAGEELLEEWAALIQRNRARIDKFLAKYQGSGEE